MISKGVKKTRLVAAAGLLTIALASAPASAHQGGHSYVAPLAAFIALNAFIHHNHHGHSQRWHYRHHGHHRPHHRKHHRKHSHSHGGYHAPRHGRYKHW